MVRRLANIKPAAPLKQNTNNSNGKPASSGTSVETRQQKTMLTNNTLPTSESVSGSFALLKGKLHLPIRGEVKNRFGSNREDSGISWKGLFIRAND